MTQTEQTVSAMPETDPAPHVNRDDESDKSSDHGDSDDDDFDELDDLVKNLRIWTTRTKNERNAFRDRNQVLEDEIVELRERNAEHEESSRRLRAQLDQAEVQLQTSETIMERLSQQVAETEERVRASENDLENARAELDRTRRNNLLWPITDAVKFQSVQHNFGPHIAEALSSLPADPVYCRRYHMTSSTPAQGPDRRAYRHPEFEPAHGSGLFVILRDRVAWLRIWLQEQH
jgi:hypothetical protein